MSSQVVGRAAELMEWEKAVIRSDIRRIRVLPMSCQPGNRIRLWLTGHPRLRNLLLRLLGLHWCAVHTHGHSSDLCPACPR